MIKIKKTVDSIEVSLVAIKLGEDWNISIFGGDRPHIGAVALGVPRESLSDCNKVSSSVSVLTVTGHMEDELIVPLAKKLSRKLNSKIVIACGIHKDNITFEEIKNVVNTVNELVDEFIFNVDKACL